MENGRSAVERLSVNRRSQESNPLVHSAAEMSRPYLARCSAGIILREVFEASVVEIFPGNSRRTRNPHVSLR